MTADATAGNSSPHLAILQFESAIEEVVKRHDPMIWAYECATRLRRWGTPSQGKWLPHELLDSIEACCRYRRGNRNEPVTEQRVRQAVNVYRAHGDPYTNYILLVEKDLDLFVMVMRRQQLELQTSQFEQAILMARHMWLFGRGELFAKTNARMRIRFGCDTKQLLYLAIALQGTADEHQYCVVRRSQLIELAKLDVPTTAVDHLLSALCRSWEQIRDEYVRDKEETLKSPQLRFSIRSPFLEYPLVGNPEVMVAPLPHLITKALGSIVWRLGMESADQIFLAELSDSLEAFVHMLAEIPFPSASVHREGTLQQLTRGKVTDLLVVLEDCVMIVECKATRFTSRFIVKGSLASDTSTRRIIEALSQIGTMKTHIRNGVFHKLGVAKDAQIIPIIVTLDDLAFPNSDWYWNCAFGDHIAKNPELAKSLIDLPIRPQIMSSTEFALLASLLANGAGPVLNVISTKLAQPYPNVGDWTPYLETIMPKGKYVVPQQLLSLVDEMYEDVEKRLSS